MSGVFVGREPELATLGSALAEAAGGQPCFALVAGPEGIGKTALVRRLLTHIKGVGVLSVSGEETEAALAYGVADQLVRASGLARSCLPNVLGEVAGSGADPFGVGAGLLELFGLAQEAAPLVVVVDDAHWADPPSLQALTFALRRLQADRILTLVCVGDEGHHLPEGLTRLAGDEQGVEMHLGGLEARQLQDLATALGAGRLSTAAAVRLREQTGGNPLYVRALLEEGTAFETLQETGVPLPAPRAFALAVLARLGRCSPAARELVAAAAVMGLHCPLTIASSVAGLDDPLTSLEEAVTARLLEAPAGLSAPVSFHPLVRAAIYHDLGPARRAGLHRQAALLVGDEATRLRHLVRATPAPDPALSAQVAAFARGEAAAGSWAAAATHVRWAVQLAPADEKDQLVVEAAEAAIFAGDIAGAGEFITQVQTQRESGWRSYLLGLVAFMSGQLDDAEHLLLAAWTPELPQVDPNLAARVSGQLGALCVQQARGAEAAEWARRLLDLMGPGMVVPASPWLNLAVGLVHVGRWEQAWDALAWLGDPAPTGAAEQLGAVVARGLLRCWSDDLTGARADVSAVEAARGLVPFQLRLVALHVLAEAEYRAGDWDDAITRAELGVSIAEDAGQVWLQMAGHSVAVEPLDGRGEWTRAEAHAQAA
ncbi:MAG TPA: AAA family ATPase, partial [Chloroflexota bacterium]|nr:AAA family ATPase [Chloroflexota bacterium]